MTKFPNKQKAKQTISTYFCVIYRLPVQSGVAIIDYITKLSEWRL